MEETLKITFEIGGEKIIIETDAASLESSIEKVKKIGKFILSDSKSKTKTIDTGEIPARRGRKPGRKKLLTESAAEATTERKKPGPKPGSKRKKSASVAAGRPKKASSARAKKNDRSGKENPEAAMAENIL